MRIKKTAEDRCGDEAGGQPRNSLKQVVCELAERVQRARGPGRSVHRIVRNSKGLSLQLSLQLSLLKMLLVVTGYWLLVRLL